MTSQVEELATLDRYLHDIRRASPLIHAEDTEFSRQAGMGDERGPQAPYGANLRLVVSTAKRYQGRGLPLKALIQEGNIDPMKAAEEFDVERGWQSSTYATWWIQQNIQRAVADKGRAIRMSIYVGIGHGSSPLARTSSSPYSAVTRSQVNWQTR